MTSTKTPSGLSEAVNLNENLASQVKSGKISADTASALWESYEQLNDQRYVDYGKKIAQPAQPISTGPKTEADFYKESLFSQVEKGDLKFGKAVQMWEAYQEKQEKKAHRRAEVLSTPVEKPGLGKESDYQPVDNEQTNIYRNLKDLADRGLISPKLAEAAWKDYAETEYPKHLQQEASTVNENLTIQINKGWIEEKQAQKVWGHFEQQQDAKFAKGPPTFGRR